MVKESSDSGRSLSLCMFAAEAQACVAQYTALTAFSARLAGAGSGDMDLCVTSHRSLLGWLRKTYEQVLDRAMT